MSGDNDTDVVEKSSNATMSLLDNWKGIIAYMLLSLVLYVVVSTFGVPEWLITIIKATIILFIPFWFISATLVQWITEDNRQQVYALNAAENFEITPWKVPRDIWQNKKSIEEGKIFYNDEGEALVREADWDGEQLNIRSTWMGLKNDNDLAAEMKNIEFNRKRLLWWAKLGQNFYVGLPHIVQSITNSAYKSVGEDIMTAQAGERMSQLVENEIVQNAEQLTDSIEPPEDSKIADQVDSEEAAQEVAQAGEEQ